MYYLKIEINDLPKLGNRVLRRHHFANYSDKKKWHSIINLHVINQRPRYPLKKAKLKFTRCFWRVCDWDGFVTSLKPVVDGLVLAGVIVDDSYKVTGPWDCRIEFRPKSLGPLLIIEVKQNEEN